MLERQRTIGSIILATLFTAYMSIGTEILSGRGAPITALFTGGSVAIVVYRAWPAFGPIWQRWQTPEARRSLRPTPSRIVGTAVLVMVLTPVLLAIDRLIFRSATVDAVDALKTLGTYGIVIYLVWPSIEGKVHGWPR
ncbi:MAG: hypothetical protein IT338_00650 [Thermomicrobiales bacterium]|nr:hypothetical protein [Thermomicrobiales bacterium]